MVGRVDRKGRQIVGVTTAYDLFGIFEGISARRRRRGRLAPTKTKEGRTRGEWKIRGEKEGDGRRRVKQGESCTERDNSFACVSRDSLRLDSNMRIQ